MAKVAVVLAQDFEDSEFSVPAERLKAQGHDVVIIGSRAGAPVTGKRGKVHASIDTTVDRVTPESFAALLIPGGYAPDKLRLDADIVAFVARFLAAGKPVAAICHGPQLLIEADAVRGRTLTSWASVRKDLLNAGANWVDREVVEDGNLITSRKPDDLDAFCDALLRHLSSAIEANGN